ncbi:hypothetical protein F5J12DRAFT_904163 [Pisolithus orientalis]|uniref:uncharacterized protein n=1 Tax=Pisolithus orientalis TaxID=936130 RepID=UPI002224BF19|nr:uncharacterized protein F5J12DRAFT_904163 [Pisolithus orientalis]KAI6019753.1 hypothetical protein F5J12DRAFT_904163 [Pisolithus orientalis]
MSCSHIPGLEEIEISYCACTPAPIHLMGHGLFACYPISPTLAFMRKLFVQLTPNTTAWCEALESFLDAQGYKLHNAYHGYTVLTIYMEDHITGLVHSSQASVQQDTRSQPSDYLHAFCPLCFGGVNGKFIDANLILTSKSLGCIKQTNKDSTGHDPSNPTNTVFIPKSEVKVMEIFIEKQQSLPSDHHHSSPQKQGDSFEDGMRVPISVLDGCGDSFHAADEKCEKASTHFFADTGLMALLCHDDHVLWLVNMTSAGEKQHYALVLLKHLFEHLPTTTTVGLLYDIGCQLECSCHKWKLLDEGILSRLKFGISVFHAYGHQWPCQIVYHPHKCVGFGLSDGEGCDQLWSSLKMLIPILQVSGYHQRLFVLDNQICHFDKKSFTALGQWLNKKWSLCKSKKTMALGALHALHVDMQTLQEEWAAQSFSYVCHHVAHHTHIGQSKKNGAEQLALILALEKSVQNHQSHVDQLEMDLHNDYKKKSALGVSAQTDLYLLRNNKWLQTQTNAQALKHKFEFEWLEQSSKNSVNENNLQSHPAISKLVTSYITLCDELMGMIQLGKAPPGAISPFPIPPKGIVQLEVDSDIWQDVGLAEGCANPPSWLADEGVHKGIRLMLEVDSCNKEERILSREQSALQEWFSVEWQSVQVTLEHAALIPSRPWGPRAEEIAGCLVAANNPSVISAAEDQTEGSLKDYDSDGEGLMSEGDDNLLLSIEEMTLEEEYSMGEADEEQSTEDEKWLQDIENGYLPSSPVKLPLKRWRY